MTSSRPSKELSCERKVADEEDPASSRWLLKRTAVERRTDTLDSFSGLNYDMTDDNAAHGEAV